MTNDHTKIEAVYSRKDPMKPLPPQTGVWPPMLNFILVIDKKLKTQPYIDLDTCPSIWKRFSVTDSNVGYYVDNQAIIIEVERTKRLLNPLVRAGYFIPLRQIVSVSYLMPNFRSGDLLVYESENRSIIHMLYIVPFLLELSFRLNLG